LQELVRALREVTSAEAVALLHRDGSVLATDLPPGLSKETFSIMCAAILGAGMTAATELRHAPPHRVILESKDAMFLISEVGRRAMVVIVIPPERPVSELVATVDRFAQAVTRQLG
jgi:predicted regulator of Ras-like GTPase activity (Roadblock/LC7/MglB family)